MNYSIQGEGKMSESMDKPEDSFRRFVPEGDSLIREMEYIHKSDAGGSKDLREIKSKHF